MSAHESMADCVPEMPAVIFWPPAPSRISGETACGQASRRNNRPISTANTTLVSRNADTAPIAPDCSAQITMPYAALDTRPLASDEAIDSGSARTGVHNGANPCARRTAPASPSRTGTSTWRNRAAGRWTNARLCRRLRYRARSSRRSSARRTHPRAMRDARRADPPPEPASQFCDAGLTFPAHARLDMRTISLPTGKKRIEPVR